MKIVTRKLRLFILVVAVAALCFLCGGIFSLGGKKSTNDFDTSAGGHHLRLLLLLKRHGPPQVPLSDGMSKDSYHVKQKHEPHKHTGLDFAEWTDPPNIIKHRPWNVPAPMPSPTNVPPTFLPTPASVIVPTTESPTSAPLPSESPTSSPTTAPTPLPSRAPVLVPTLLPTARSPSSQPSRLPSSNLPSSLPSSFPTSSLDISESPSRSPTTSPSSSPSSLPVLPTPFPSLDITDCYDNLTALDADERTVTNLDVVRDYVLCRDTTFVTGTLTDEGEIDGGFRPLTLRKNMRIHCGEIDGGSENNCVIRDGSFGLTSIENNFEDATVINTGVIVRGVTFDDAAEIAVLIGLAGGFRFIDCVFTDHESSSVPVLIEWEGGSIGDTMNRRVLGSSSGMYRYSPMRKEVHGREDGRKMQAIATTLEVEFIDCVFKDSTCAQNSRLGLINLGGDGINVTFTSCLFSNNDFNVDGVNDALAYGVIVENFGNGTLSFDSTCWVGNKAHGNALVADYSAQLPSVNGDYGSNNEVEFLADLALQCEFVAQVDDESPFPNLACADFEADECSFDISEVPTSPPVVTLAPTPAPTFDSEPRDPRLGLQSSCFVNDEGAYNVCLDLNSISGEYESWMDRMVDAASDMERVVTGHVGDVIPPPILPSEFFPSLDITCTEFPEAIDDIYICVKDRVYPEDDQDRVRATAGPYLFRPTENAEELGKPYASGISVNVNFVDDPNIYDTFRHEIFHALGFPRVTWENGLFDGLVYRNGTKADNEWKAIGCSGQIPLEPFEPPRLRPGHWDEACMVDELMSPTASGNRALSRISIAALEDLGYAVNYDMADGFTIDDLADGCGDGCPEALFLRRDIGSDQSPIKRFKPKADTFMKGEIMGTFTSDLVYFHEQLEKAGYVERENGLYYQRGRKGGFAALPQIDVLYVGSDGEYRDLTVTYDDVKGLA